MNTLKNLQNRLLMLDTASISDALDSLYIVGDLKGIKLRTPDKKIAGPAFTVQYEAYEPKKNTFMNAGNYIDDVPAGAVIVIDNCGREDCTSWGNILTTKAQQRNVEGTVVYGSARDIADIKKMNYPLFSSSIYMVSGKNRTRVRALQCELNINGVKIAAGDWIMGDENGVLVIPKKWLEEVIIRAENVVKTEQRILSSVNEGKKLEDARNILGYASPWVSKI